jgi:hypothetical protein
MGWEGRGGWGGAGRGGAGRERGGAWRRFGDAELEGLCIRQAAQRFWQVLARMMTGLSAMSGRLCGFFFELIPVYHGFIEGGLGKMVRRSRE